MTILQKFALVLAVITAAAIGGRLWLARHDAAMLEGYVAATEKAAAESAAREAERQRDAAAQALEEYRKRAAADQAADAAREIEITKEISDYEAQLTAARRDCRLDTDDIDHILRHR